MSNKTIFSKCKNHCNYPTMTKDEIESAIAAGGKTCFIKGSYDDINIGSVIYEYNGVDPKTISVTAAGNILAAAISLIIDSENTESAPVLGSSDWITKFINASQCIFKVWISGKECTVTNCRISNGNKVKDGLFIFVENERTLTYTANSSNLYRVLYTSDLNDLILAKKYAQGAGSYKIDLNTFYKVQDTGGFKINLKITDDINVVVADALYSSEICILSVYADNIYDPYYGQTLVIKVNYTVNGEEKIHSSNLILDLVSPDNQNLNGYQDILIELNSESGVIYKFSNEGIISGYVSNEHLQKRIINIDNEVASLSTGLDTKLADYATSRYVNEMFSQQNQLVLQPLKNQVNEQEKRLTNLELSSKGITYTTAVHTGNELVKIVPENAMPYALLNKVGGKTLKVVQVNKMIKDFTKPITNGIKLDVNLENQTIRYYGTIETEENYVMYGLFVSSNIANMPKGIKGHKYLIRFNLSGTKPIYSEATFGWSLPGDGVSREIKDTIITCNNDVDTNMYGQISINKGASVDFTIQPQIFDLTAMFGVNNEPTAIEEFNHYYRNTYYEFTEGMFIEIKPIKVTTTKGSIIDFSNIPLDYLGKSVKDTGNYINFETKKAVKQVIDYVFTGDEINSNGTEFWQVQNGDYPFIYGGFNNTNIKLTPIINSGVTYQICNKFETNNIDIVSNFNGIQLYASNIVRFRDPNIDTPEKLKAYLKEQYEKGDPIIIRYVVETTEEDLTNYLPADNYIEVDPNGNILFENTGNTAIPSEIEYQLKVV